MFAIGVGPNINQPELEGIANPPEGNMSYALRAENFDKLTEIAFQLLSSACEAVESKKTMQCFSSFDFVFSFCRSPLTVC
jgi:hypothetical protein